EMLTGKKAFGADSMHSVLFKVVSEDPPPLAIAAPDVPTELEPIVQMSLLKDAHERYQSASEMANDLTAARGLIAGRDPSESISLSATLAPHVRRVAAARLDPAKRVVRARWIVFAAAIVAAVALVSGTYAYTKYASRSMDIVAAPREPALPLRNAVTDSNVERLPAAAPNDTVVVPSAPKPITGERDIVREVRRAAIAERAGALKGGITAGALAGGDTQLARADRLAAAGKLPDAVQALNAATLAWREAARSSTASAPLNPAPSLRTTPPDSTRLPASLPPPIVSQRREAEVVLPPVRRPDSVQSSATTGASASDATREILTLIAEWGAALESRDISRLRTLYPSITPQQTERFDQFFHAVRSLKASLDAGTPEVNGNVGSTRVSGTYQFVDLNGKSQRQPASFVATLQRDGSTWRIRSIQ
ncbi:MAG: hypothetical protein ABI877_10385, partial [Gemmatimonadaceae bacterium]